MDHYRIKVRYPDFTHVLGQCLLLMVQSSRSEGVFDDIFSYFSLKLYVVTPHLNRLETVQMSGHKISFYAELTKIITNYHQYSFLSSTL